MTGYFLTGGQWGSSLNNLYFNGRRVDALDRLGSEVISANGYYPYGEQYTTTANDTFTFATYYRDQTSGVDYSKNRYYSSVLVRFLSADPYMATARRW
jgi:RHS repeat-associated protein